MGATAGRSALSPLSDAIDVFKGKWKPYIVLTIRQSETGRVRYNDLKKALPAKATHKMLSQHLHELEDDGVLLREAFDEMPPRVEYSLTQKGESLAQLLVFIWKWGTVYGNRSKGPDDSRLAS